jgi:squalene cyclase
MALVSATYHNRDVTAQVRQIAQQNGGILRFSADFNSNFGDPAPGVPKALQVNVGGQIHNFGEGQWNQVQIRLGGGGVQQAMYHNRDVTAQVQQIVQQNGGTLRFQRDFNSIFGDPAPGVPKMLQVNVNGQIHNFAEGQWNQVNIAAGGGGGGGVQQATYHNRDVTAQVNQIIQQNGGVIRFQRDFNSIFGDPAPGVPKNLSINVNGQIHNFGEGQWNQVNIAAGGGGGGHAGVQQATYHNRDVTAQVNQIVQQNGGVLRFQRDFNSIFGDPAPGVPKSLQVNVNGQIHNFGEGQWNQVNVNCGGGGGGFRAGY